MKVTIERATLLKGLSHVQSVVERRNTIPILSNVLLEATAAPMTPTLAWAACVPAATSMSAPASARW